MNVTTSFRGLLSIAALCAVGGSVFAAENTFDAELLSIQHEWAAANYQATEKRSREAAFAALVEHATQLSSKYSDRVEAVAWEGIVLSTYAGEVSAMSAMKYAKAARDVLLHAERMGPAALRGGIYASLGALYSKVPGGFMGFGDDEVAAEYFRKALAMDPDNIDSNFFYGEYLMDQGDYADAVTVLTRALQAPTVVGRPLFDAGRRNEIRTLLATAQRKATL
ncbi:MAG TPA: tetratricopeptide repeat protein [Gammaproteobacteria bacterium]|nr:tetratricopeptide repeat protein [Gammaproteobacteria bacterium]